MPTDDHAPTPLMQTTPGESQEHALMASIAMGDREAFSRLYDRFSAPVMAYCLRALHDRADAEDLVVDVFAEVWQRAGRYDPARSKPFTYLINLTRARLIDRLRSRKSKERRSAPIGSNDGGDTVNAAPESSAGPLSDAVMAEQRSRVLRALESLTADQREVVELAFFDAFSHSEISEKLGKPLGTVKLRIRQAIARLRDLLSGDQT